MNENQDWNKLRSDIADTAKNILKNADYEGMINNITDAAHSAIDEVASSISRKYERDIRKHNRHLRRELERSLRYRDRFSPDLNENVPNSMYGPYDDLNGMEAENNTLYYKKNKRTGINKYSIFSENFLSNRKFRPAKQISSMMILLFFCPLAFAMCLAMILFITLNITVPLSVYVIFSITALISFFMIFLSCVNLSTINESKKFMNVIGSKSYINLSVLAQFTGKSISHIRKSLKKMIDQGIFPQGHFDKEELCFMLDNETYNEYLAIEVEKASLKLNAKNETSKVDEKDTESDYPEAASLNEEDRKKWFEIIEMGKKYTQDVNRLNESIKSEVVSEKLSILENLLRDIFARIKEKPEEISHMYKFMDYYLPTTLKLVQTYDDFERITQPGEDVIEAKKEIEATLDTINLAFAQLLNTLFKDAAYDAATDAQVLQTMLAKEGLTGGINNKTQ